MVFCVAEQLSFNSKASLSVAISQENDKRVATKKVRVTYYLFFIPAFPPTTPTYMMSTQAKSQIGPSRTCFPEFPGQFEPTALSKMLFGSEAMDHLISYAWPFLYRKMPGVKLKVLLYRNREFDLMVSSLTYIA